MKRVVSLLIVVACMSFASAWAQVDTMMAEPIIKANYYNNTELELANVFGFAHVTPKVKKNSTSFYIQYSHAHHKGIADDERTELWYFMIPAKPKKSFSITGDQIKANKVVYCKLCYCIDAGCKPAQADWVISGKKKGKKWNIKITSPENTNYTFTATPDSFENFPK